MHNSEIQQDRITSEDVTPDFYRYEYPKVRLVRVYEPGIAPQEPNPYKFAVIAEIAESGLCVIKALSKPKNLTISDMKAGYRHLRKFGAVELHWRHDGQEQVFSG
ncbi:MAG: hypothetical protein M0R47_16700 [Methylobacter sp.]|uniref:hypothetical protein n=1 Tax=Methylobacter sp. TaxID=2051955 RepID=UPI0025FBBB55|nr:hypothetical protein [Methylobacter sp.]MCK9622162.1 hypothetical protein [Methylobacter sp.]